MITDEQAHKFYTVYHAEIETANAEFSETGNEEQFCIRQTAAFKAALEDYEKSKWQTDFNTVKNGEPILLFQDDNMEVGRWHTHVYAPSFNALLNGLYEKIDNGSRSWWDTNDCQEPTHYQLLPTPPKE